jgi:hypothetical protein
MHPNRLLPKWKWRSVEFDWNILPFPVPCALCAFACLAHRLSPPNVGFALGYPNRAIAKNRKF